MDTTTTTTNPTATDDRVSQHLRTLADEAEALLKASARVGDEKYDAARERLRAEVSHLRTRLSELEAAASGQIKRVAHRTDEVVHAHPYTAIGTAAVAGLLLGLLLGRR